MSIYSSLRHRAPSPPPAYSSASTSHTLRVERSACYVRRMKNAAAADKKTNALVAAWGWLGAYEAAPSRSADLDRFGHSVTLDDAFAECGTAGRVKARFPEFPEDMVDAFALLRRMVVARVRTGRQDS